MTLQITVTAKVPSASGSPVVVCGNSDYTVQFTFDSEWDNSADKVAVFQYIENCVLKTIQVPFTGSTCDMPVITDADTVAIGVYADAIRTTAPVRIPCARCITDAPAQPFELPEDVYNQIMEALAQHIPPQPAVTVILLRDADGYGLLDAEGYALRMEV